MKVTTDAVQVLGGYSYTLDFRVERYMREAKITQIFEGTNQIQRLVISRTLGPRRPFTAVPRHRAQVLHEPEPLRWRASDLRPPRTRPPPRAPAPPAAEKEGVRR